MEIRFDKDLPEEIKQAIMPHLNDPQVSRLIPSWCHHIQIGFDPNESEFSLSCLTEYGYRWTRITVHPHFLLQQGRHEHVLHEVLHIALAPMMDFARQALKTAFRDDSPEKRVILDQLIERAESVIQDLTYALQKQSDGSDPSNPTPSDFIEKTLEEIGLGKKPPTGFVQSD